MNGIIEKTSLFFSPSCLFHRCLSSSNEKLLIVHSYSFLPIYIMCMYIETHAECGGTSKIICTLTTDFSFRQYFKFIKLLFSTLNNIFSNIQRSYFITATVAFFD